MPTNSSFPIEGGCACQAVRYRMETRPLFVHCCHCRWCQRETGASFALNAMIETDRLTNLGIEPELVGTLDNPDALPPQIHIFTRSKQPWVILPADVPAVPEYYEREAFWPADSLARRLLLLPALEAYQAKMKS